MMTQLSFQQTGAWAGMFAVITGISLLTAGANGQGTIQMTSGEFANGGSIPARNTCDGQNISPSLTWTGVPPNARSLTLIMDDPDAPGGTWVHWVVYNLQAADGTLPAGVPKIEFLAAGARQGLNDFKLAGYGGPCPPQGTKHRYIFKLYALDTTLPLKSGATQHDVDEAMKSHIVATAELMGTYQRR